MDFYLWKIWVGQGFLFPHSHSWLTEFPDRIESEVQPTWIPAKIVATGALGGMIILGRFTLSAEEVRAIQRHLHDKA